MMSETFTNWLIRLQNLTHAGHAHTCSCYILYNHNDDLFNLSDNEKGREGCCHPESWQRVGEVSVGEDEGGAQGGSI